MYSFSRRVIVLAEDITEHSTKPLQEIKKFKDATAAHDAAKAEVASPVTDRRFQIPISGLA